MTSLLRAAAFLMLLVASPALADDTALRDALIGNWVSVTRDGDLPDHMLQVFRANGSGSAYFFRDDSCRVLLAKIDVTWKVENGVLITLYREGYSDHDAIIDLAPGALTLRSIQRAQDVRKVKATACPEPRGQ